MTGYTYETAAEGLRNYYVDGLPLFKGTDAVSAKDAFLAGLNIYNEEIQEPLMGLRILMEERKEFSDADKKAVDGVLTTFFKENHEQVSETLLEQLSFRAQHDGLQKGDAAVLKCVCEAAPEAVEKFASAARGSYPFLAKWVAPFRPGLRGPAVGGTALKQ